VDHVLNKIMFNSSSWSCIELRCYSNWVQPSPRWMDATKW